MPEYMRARESLGETDSEDFTLESEEEDQSQKKEKDDDEDDIEELLLMLAYESSRDADFVMNEEVADDDLVLREKLSHLDSKASSAILRILRDTNVTASTLQDLGPADVLIRLAFDLTDERPIYHTPRRMAPKHNEIIRREMYMMLAAAIVPPATSAWSFPVVIATKKNGKPRFCVDYRMLNQRMKADRFPLPKVQEVFDELAGGVVFTTLDLFSGYGKIKMSEDCREEPTFFC